MDCLEILPGLYREVAHCYDRRGEEVARLLLRRQVGNDEHRPRRQAVRRMDLLTVDTVDGREFFLVPVILLGEVDERVAVLHDMPATYRRLAIRHGLAVARRLALPCPTGRIARREVHARQVLP